MPATSGPPRKESIVVAGSLSSPDASYNSNLKFASRTIEARALLKSLYRFESRVQLTNRRMRTFITRPKAKNTKAVADPP